MRKTLRWTLVAMVGLTALTVAPARAQEVGGEPEVVVPAPVPTDSRPVTGNFNGIGRDTVHDSGDASHATAAASEQFAEAELSAGTLAEIRAALGRIDAGTFGACAVDGAPIEEARLAAVPWAAHCLAHAEQAEAAAADTMPTL